MSGRRPGAPEGNGYAYGASIGMSALLCFAWLLTDVRRFKTPIRWDGSRRIFNVTGRELRRRQTVPV